MYLGSVARRSLLLAGAGFGLAGGMFSKLRVAHAQPITGAPPEVDQLAVRVVTDSFQHQLEPSGKFGTVSVERAGHVLSQGNPRGLRNEWGLSLHLQSTQGTETRQVLVDFGFTGNALIHNLEMLGIEPGRLDAMLLTHGHYDHFGGMADFLAVHGKSLKPRLSFYVGGEEAFCARESGPANAPLSFGVLDRGAIENAGITVVVADRPSSLAGHGFTTGSISQTSFEKPVPPTRMKIGQQADGLGCSAETLDPAKRSSSVVPDDFQHEQATCFSVKGRGLVVLTSCGHRGIVNSVQGAVKVSGGMKLHAVVGGFHLMPMPEDYVRSTVKALKEMNPDYLIPMHCSGLAFYEIAKQEMPGRVLLSSTGTRFTFGG